MTNEEVATLRPPVLVAEDDPTRVELVCRLLAEGGLVNPVTAVPSGTDAIAYLAGRGRFADRVTHPLPAVVVTRHRLPGADGLAVLRATRTDPDLGDLPVVVLSDAADDADVAEAHRLGAAAYLVEPVGLEALVDVIRGLGMPWSVHRPASTHQHATAGVA